MGHRNVRRPASSKLPGLWHFTMAARANSPLARKRWPLFLQMRKPKPEGTDDAPRPRHPEAAEPAREPQAGLTPKPACLPLSKLCVTAGLSRAFRRHKKKKFSVVA